MRVELRRLFDIQDREVLDAIKGGAETPCVDQ